jgi:hypothetical protein
MARSLPTPTTRLRAALAVFLLFLVIQFPSPSYARGVSGPEVVDEPVFGLFYNPKKVHFQTISTARLLPACRKALSEDDPLPAAYVVYAKYDTATAKIYILGARNDLGIFVIHGGVCDAGVPILSLIHRERSPGEAVGGPALSDSEIAGLFSDTLNRYSKAFGGKENFLQWLDQTTKYVLSDSAGKPPSSLPPTYHLLLPAQQQQLAEFRADQ